MADYEKISGLIKRIAGTQNNALVLFEAKVKSVNAAAQTCTLTRYDTDFENVRLTAGFTGDSDLLVIPAEGSMVIAADMSAPLMRDIVVLAVSKSAGIVFQGGQNGGLVKVKELTKKLNAIEKEINDLKSALQAPQTDPQGGVLATVFTSWAGQTLTQTSQTDLENANFKH
jgi:hypothetical protein